MIKVILPLLLLLLPFGGVQGETRGIRNYNPANLVKTTIPWQGKVECRDTRFECFSTPYHGLRAMYKTIYTYYYKHNKRTIREIIHRWSPEHENRTEEIIRFISRSLVWKPDDPIPITSLAFVSHLGSLLIINENGKDPYSPLLHRRAVDNAFRNHNDARKYSASRSVKALVNEYEVQSTTATGTNREDKYEEQGSREGERDNTSTIRIHKESDRYISYIRNHHLPSNHSPILWNGSNTRLDRVAEWIPILHRREGCIAMEDCYWFGNNPTPYPPSIRDKWYVLRVEYGGEPLRRMYEIS